MPTVLWQTKTTVSFPLEDKHFVNEHHVIRKSHDATQEKCHHVVHFNVPRDWLRRKDSARKVSFRISLRWPIHIINPVDKLTKLYCNTPTDLSPSTT